MIGFALSGVQHAQEDMEGGKFSSPTQVRAH